MKELVEKGKFFMLTSQKMLTHRSKTVTKQQELALVKFPLKSKKQ